MTEIKCGWLYHPHFFKEEDVMVVNFNPASDNQKIDTEKISYGPRSRDASARIADEAMGYSLDISGNVTDDAAYGTKELSSVDDIVSDASMKNVKQERNYMAVMSNSMSTEDFGELLKEGYSPADTTIENAVTNLDKIKAKMAESGIVIEGYNDDLTSDEIKAVTGDSLRAENIEKSLSENNLPISYENVRSINDMLKTSDEIPGLSEDAVKYMVNNRLAPTIPNLYKAEFSSGNDADRQAKGYFMDQSAGYFGKKADVVDWEAIEPQAVNIIEDAGIKADDETLDDARWLVEKGIALTKENLENLKDVRSLEFPLKDREITESLAKALVDGKEVTKASLTVKTSLMDDAISLKRQLEETRLSMTAEANLHLLKKGISIDINDLEDLVEKLKESEREIYDLDSDDKVSLYKETEQLIEDVKSVPVEVLTRFVLPGRDVVNISEEGRSLAGDTVEGADEKPHFDLRSIREEGLGLKAEYERAGRAYETLMTAPRADMGDTIRKAFRNVDDILEEMDISLTAANQKAVRTLGYAGMEITDENIDVVREANLAVESVINSMTPARTLRMIRDGINPIDTDIYELANELNKENDQVENEKYSEFLFKLERSGEISEDEKSAFIGIYRLFRKIEKSDGRLVGNVLKSEDRLTLSSLLTAARSNRASGMNVAVDDKFGGLEQLISRGESITDQILKGFKRDPELDRQFVENEARQYREAMKAEDNVLKALESADQPVTANNLLAADILINSRGTAYEKLMNKASGRSKDKEDELRKAINKLHDSFVSKEDVNEAMDELNEIAKDFIQEEMGSADTYIDLREMKLLNKELAVSRGMAHNNESYEVPLMIGGKWTSINLKIIKDEVDSGRVFATFETENYGKVSAEFKLTRDSISAFIESSSLDGSKLIKEKEADIRTALKAGGRTVDSVYFARNRSLDLSRNLFDKSKETGDKVTNRELYETAKAFIGVIQD